MGLLNFINRNADFEKIETPKSYKYKQFHQFDHKEKSNEFIINFNFNAIHNTESDLSLVLINTIDISNKSNLYVVQLTIKKLQTDKSKFENKIILGQGINPHDFGGLNLARHLHKDYNWDTEYRYLRSLKTTIDFSKSKNLELNAFLNKEIIIYVTDTVGQDLYKVKLNWLQKKASIIIKKEQIKTFTNIYFVKIETSEVTVNEMKVNKIIKVKGFDKSGEPEIQVLESGILRIVFEFMPPLNGKDDYNNNPIFNDFDKILTKIIENKVIWDDREVFIIPNPKKGDEIKIKKYLEEFWKKIS